MCTTWNIFEVVSGKSEEFYIDINDFESDEINVKSVIDIIK